MMQLNREQAQCVDNDGHCLVVACPGSGKTRVITHKIEALLSRHPEARICGVTFTRDSAAELSTRVIELIGEARFNLSCRIGTFHSLAIRQLRNHKLLGNIASPAQQTALVIRAMSQSKFAGNLEEAIQLIEAGKTAFTAHPSHDEPLYLVYSEILARQKLVDLYDILRDSVQFMRDGSIHPYPVKFMLVDEFQDTDNVQLAWVMEHVKAGTNATCVGDDDQSIYSWRGALGNAGMTHFKDTCDAELITLGQNFRSHREILELADTIIRADLQRIPKVLEAANGPGGKVVMHRAGTIFNEAEILVDFIASEAVPLTPPTKLFTHTVPEGAWAILARGRKYLDVVESELQTRQIQFRRAASDSLWNRAPYLQLLTILRSIQNGTVEGVDDALHYALSNRIDASAAHAAMDKLHTIMGDKLTHIMDGHLPPNIDTIFVAEEAKVLKDFALVASGWRRALFAREHQRAINSVARWLGSFEIDEAKQKLLEKMGEYLASLKGSINERVNAVSQRENKSNKDKCGVLLTTMHSSKGLEFDQVWIVGCNDTVIPSPKSINLAEERRLLYVAATRAKRVLHLSATTENKVTPLLTEVGIEINPI